LPHFTRSGLSLTDPPLLCGDSDSCPVREVAFDKFFADLTKEEDWHEEEEKAMVEKYRNLVEVLRAQLSDLKVFRVGETEVTIDVVGKAPSGNWAGVKTAAVET
jgi:hypothetical protein